MGKLKAGLVVASSTSNKPFSLSVSFSLYVGWLVPAIVLLSPLSLRT